MAATQTARRRALVVLACAALLSGCTTVAPYERERLASPLMNFNRDPLAAKHTEHVREVREGARGATGVQGGGCGCN